MIDQVKLLVIKALHEHQRHNPCSDEVFFGVSRFGSPLQAVVGDSEPKRREYGLKIRILPSRSFPKKAMQMRPFGSVSQLQKKYAVTLEPIIV